jgi:hypothetical protein
MSDKKSFLERYKKMLGETKPWDMLDKARYAENSLAKERLYICKQCPELIKLTTQCKKCGCFMAAKSKLAEATCPLGKW